MKPLGGLRVVSLEHAVAAPLCTRYLAGLGADVIKIERPPRGDFARWYDTAVQGLSAHFVWLNAGKRSVALDLKRPTATTVLWDLLKSADVFVSNLSPGSVQRLTGADSMRDRFPRLIECAITGYSADGPYLERKAYDLLIQGEAGVTRSTGTPDHPAKAGVSVADLAGGQHAALAIVAAIVRRDHSGDGSTLKISLFDVLTDWMSPLLLASKHSRAVPPPAGTSHASIAPYGAFRCADGVWLNVAVQNEDEWRRLCTEVIRDEALLDDPRFRSNQDRVKHRVDLERRLAQVIARDSAEVLIAKLTAADIGWGKLRDIGEVVAHPELTERKRWRIVEAGTAGGPVGAVEVLRDPLETLFDGPEGDVGSVSAHLPQVGEHTFEVLRELGYSETRLAELAHMGVIARVARDGVPAAPTQHLARD